MPQQLKGLRETLSKINKTGLFWNRDPLHVYSAKVEFILECVAMILRNYLKSYIRFLTRTILRSAED
jgi:hypothetical protein